MAAAGGGDEPRRPPGQAHEYGPYKKLLLGIFRDMDNTEYMTFKQYLDCEISSDNVSIPKYLIEGTKRQKMPDLILRYIRRREALDVVARILLDLPNMQLLQRLQQFTHPEPGTAGYMVMQIKHAAESEEDYLTKCQEIAAVLDRCSPGLGNLILDEVRHRECVLVKYLLNTKELVWKRPMDIIQIMSSEESKEELRHLGVIYIKVEDATLFTGELHEDPRTWDRVEVTQWVARTLFWDPTATIPDLQMTGAEICARPEGWFINKFPMAKGAILYSDLQQRRDDVASQLRFGDEKTAENRVVEGTRAAFLVTAYQICMIFYLLGEQLGKASKVLHHLYQLVDVVKRRVDPDLFKEGRMKHSIRNRAELDCTQVSLVHGSKCIPVADETYSKIVTSLSEAMEVIGAPLTIKINLKMPFWKKAVSIGVAATTVAVTGGAAAYIYGASLAASALIGGGAAALTTAAVYAIAVNERKKHLLGAYEAFLAKEQRTVEFTSNYLRAVLLTTKIVDRSNMTEIELGRFLASVEEESRESVIQQVERKMMKILPYISRLPSRLSESLVNLCSSAKFEYKATAWLDDNSVKDVNNSILIAYLQFGMRRLMRDMFILGAIGPQGNSNKTLVKSVFPSTIRTLEQSSASPCDIELLDGSDDMKTLNHSRVKSGQVKSVVPVLLFPSEENAVTKATLGLWTRSCSAFICVVDYSSTSGYPNLPALEAVAGLCVPVLLCINTEGRVRSHGEAERAIKEYTSGVSSDLRELVQVMLVDVSNTDKPPWIMGAGDVKYWIQDALDHHQEHADKQERDNSQHMMSKKHLGI